MALHFTFVLMLYVRAQQRSGGSPLEPGEAVRTKAYGLSPLYASIVHTIPPFYRSVDWEVQLKRAWETALGLGIATDWPSIEPESCVRDSIRSAQQSQSCLHYSYMNKYPLSSLAVPPEWSRRCFLPGHEVLRRRRRRQ